MQIWGFRLLARYDRPCRFLNWCDLTDSQIADGGELKLASPPVGTPLLGSGLVFIRGRLLALDTRGRLLIHAISVGGCSGTPVHCPGTRMSCL